MKHELQTTTNGRNTLGLTAGMLGFACALGLMMGAVLCVAFALGAGDTLLRVLCVEIAGSVLIGSIALLALEFVNPSVHTPKDFFGILGIAFKYALKMPLVVPALLILAVAWKQLLFIVVRVYLMSKGKQWPRWSNA